MALASEPSHVSINGLASGETHMHRWHVLIAACALASGAAAQNLVIYDEALRNGFVGAP